MTVKDLEDPAVWDDLFTCDVDERPVQFVRPADTDRPTWAAYEGGTYLGTVSAEPDGGRPLWRVQTTLSRRAARAGSARPPHDREQGSAQDPAGPRIEPSDPPLTFAWPPHDPADRPLWNLTES